MVYLNVVAFKYITDNEYPYSLGLMCVDCLIQITVVYFQLVDSFKN